MIMKAILRNYQPRHHRRMTKTISYTLQHNSYSAVMRVKEMTAAIYAGETFNTRCPDCTGCQKCEKIQVDTSHEENEIISNSMKLDYNENRIPMRDGWQEKISDTSMQAKARIKREIIKLSSFPKQRDELA